MRTRVWVGLALVEGTQVEAMLVEAILVVVVQVEAMLVKVKLVVAAGAQQGCGWVVVMVEVTVVVMVVVG